MAISNKGFTLLELVLVMAIIAGITTVGLGYYRNFVKNIELDSAYTGIISTLKNAQAKSMAGTDNRKWGIHVVNGAEDYYELFSTPTNYADSTASISETVYLTSRIAFSVPTEGNTQDIIFNKILGTTTAASVSLTFESQTKNITIKSVGNIY